MIVEFSVGNFRSFKNIKTLSLNASKKKSQDNEIDENNLIKVNKDLTLLKSAVIYGANASGKSNLISAMTLMITLVRHSLQMSQEKDGFNTDIFELSTDNENKPSFFQLIFISKNCLYRYGFEISKDRIISEWLFLKSLKLYSKEVRLFTRDIKKIIINRTRLKEATRYKEVPSNVLYLTYLGNVIKTGITKNLFKWFQGEINSISSLEDETYKTFTILNFEKNFKDVIIEFTKKIDLGFDDIRSEKLKDKDLEGIPPNVKKQIVKNERYITTKHKKYNKSGKYVSNEYFHLDSMESKGTQKLFYLSGPLIDTLMAGRTLFIDELDASLHPIITASIVKLFNSKELNYKNAQLIFATHDTNILNHDLFRRDQIWFTEKDAYGSTDLFSLVEFKNGKTGIRNDEKYGKNYIKGKYGAIPFLGNFSNLIKDKDSVVQ